jgi:hypothetical protein
VNHKSRLSKASHMRFIWAVTSMLLAALALEKQPLAADSGTSVGAPNQPCAAITEPEARLRCYDRLVPEPQQQGLPDSQSMSGWRLVRTPGSGGSEGVSVTHTADMLRSDPDFAGLALHCGRNGPEILLFVIQPFPPKAKPQVSLGGLINEVQFEASVLPSGAALLLPDEAMTLANGPWLSLVDLPVTIKSGATTIHGVVPLNGLAAALKTITASCSSNNQK